MNLAGRALFYKKRYRNKKGKHHGDGYPFLDQSLNVAVLITYFSDGTWHRWSELFWVYTFY